MKLNRVYFTKKYATGSLAQRHNKMQEYTSQIYSAVMDKYDAALKKNNRQLGPDTEEFIPIRTLEKITKKILPERLSFKIARKQNKDIGYSCEAEIADCYINGHYLMTKIFLPTTNRKLNIDYLPHFIHEITHLLDHALNPIRIKVCEKLCKKSMHTDTQNRYYELLYTNREIPIEQIENEIKKILRDLSVEDKLLVLKYFKLGLSGEKTAYSAEKIYFDKLKTERCHNLIYDDTYEKNYRFDEKLRLINKMRSEIISEERENMWFFRNYDLCSKNSDKK